MKINRITCISIILLLTGIAQSVQASLISADLTPGSGDGYLTIDTTQRLQFLDLTLTAGFSPNQILSGDSGYLDLGFRYANRTEVANLYLEAGPYNDASGYYSENFEPAAKLLSLMGITCCPSPDFDSATGIFFENGRFEFGAVSTILSDSTAQMQPYIGYVSPDLSSQYFSHYLVKPQSIPEPSVLALCALGLLGLGFARRRTYN